VAGHKVQPCYNSKSICPRPLALRPLRIPYAIVAERAGATSHTATMKTTAERFWEKVNKDGPIPPHMPHLGKCWVWIGALSRGDYGSFSSKNHNTKQAHRISWVLHNGKIRKKLKVCHHCDNTSCVRPTHLFLGTNSENMLDCSKKGRFNNRVGVNAAAHKLSNEQVFKIRAIKKSGLRQNQVARLFGVDKSTVSNIWLRKTWKHI